MTAQAMNFGEYVAMLRLERHLTLAKAARRMGFTSQKLCDIEKGRRYQKRISLSLASTIAKAYGVPISEIIRNTEAAITHDKTVSELLDELWPKSRYAELVGENLVTEARKLAPDIENRAVELSNTVKEMRGLLSLLRKRYFRSEETSDPKQP